MDMVEVLLSAGGSNAQWDMGQPLPYCWHLVLVCLILMYSNIQHYIYLLQLWHSTYHSTTLQYTVYNYQHPKDLWRYWKFLEGRIPKFALCPQGNNTLEGNHREWVQWCSNALECSSSIQQLLCWSCTFHQDKEWVQQFPPGNNVQLYMGPQL